ncbi:DUF1971 domain-containing protein [Sorangium sp. So ce1078]|uniref:DUF1971 domain-containing protein n=1 Tax=Sorangium sp. So ce1078 TaxID=3133329 RepID=UPI003F63AB83
MPDGLVAYKRTAEFDEGSIPSGLRKNHATRPVVWGVIHVVSGRLSHRIHSDGLSGREMLIDRSALASSRQRCCIRSTPTVRCGSSWSFTAEPDGAERREAGKCAEVRPARTAGAAPRRTGRALAGMSTEERAPSTADGMDRWSRYRRFSRRVNKSGFYDRPRARNVTVSCETLRAKRSGLRKDS